jgi:hypothetical protein
MVEKKSLKPSPTVLENGFKTELIDLLVFVFQAILILVLT